MIDPARVRSNMEVRAADGTVVGRVDGIEAGRIKLSRSDSPDGRHHFVPLDLVERVDEHVHLSIGREALGPYASAPSASATDGAAAGAATAGDGLLPPVRNPAVQGARPRTNFYLPWIAAALLLLLSLYLLFRAFDEGERDGREHREADRQATDTRGALAAYAAGTIAGDLDRFLSSSDPTPRTFTFDRLNFDSGSAAIRQADIGDVDQLAQVLTAHPAARVAIVGYTDAEGSGRANARLGQERADALVSALTVRGIAAERLEARSGGEQSPVADNRRSAGRAENRRTELIVLSR